MTSWPFTPTTIFASSRRLSGSTRSKVCSFWFATTSTPSAGDAGLASRSLEEAKSVTKTSNKDMRASMHHLGENSSYSSLVRSSEDQAEYIFSRRQRLRWRFFLAGLLRLDLRAAGFELRSPSRVFFGSLAKTMS